MLVAFHVQTRHAGLLPLLDDKPHGQVSVAPFVIIDELALHITILKSVGLIEGANGIDVILQQLGRISSRRCIGGGLNFYAAPEKIRAEVFIAGEFHIDQPVVVAAKDLIGDDSGGSAQYMACFIRGSIRRGVVHLRVKVSGAFKPVAQRTPPFLEQVLVHRAFLVDGNQLAQSRRRNLRAFHDHAHFQPRIQCEIHRHAIRLRIIRAAVDRDSRSKIIFARQPFSRPVGRAIQAV